MAIEGQTEVPNGGAPASEGAEKPAAGQSTGEQKPAAVAGAQPEKTRDYDREIAGVKADLAKERKARQQYDADLKAAKAELETERRRVKAALGIEQPNESDVEAGAVRERFKALYPHLADLTEEDVKALRAMKATAGNFEQTTNHYWSQHNVKMIGSVVDTIAKELGGGELSPRQKQRIAQAYAQEATVNEEFLDRHEKGDKSLITEFAKQWIEDWVEPARRKATQQETQRFRPVPSGKDRNIVTHGDKKIDVNDPKAVEDFLVKGFRERNGEFKGRR